MQKPVRDVIVVVFTVLVAIAASAQTPPTQPEARQVPDDVKAVLDKPVTLDVAGKTGAILHKIHEATGLRFGYAPGLDDSIYNFLSTNLTIKVDNLPLRDVLAELVKQLPEGVCFVAISPLEYDIWPIVEAVRIPGATIPPQVPFKPVPQPSIPDKLEDALALAFKNNLDVVAAEARLRAAEAELNQAKEHVAEELTNLYAQWPSLKLRKETAQQLLEDRKKEQESHLEMSVSGMTNKLREAQGNLLQFESRVWKLMSPPATTVLPAPAAPPQTSAPRPPVPEKYRQLLEKGSPITLNGGDKNLDKVSKVVELLNLATKVKFVLATDAPVQGFNFTDAPPIEIMNVLSEMTGNKICFVFRDYGVLVTETKTAKNIPGAIIPDYVPYTGPALNPESAGPGAEEANGAK
ncbi:MAG TPA: hypothetical protein PLI09_19510 [Candidatus Hydrogenedentes bacterium]|nr:hypothetical protein [Candidatus Hydrogenedentota bacterium]